MPALAAARALWRACVHLPAPDHLRVRFTPNQHLLAESCDLVGVLDFEHDLARAGAATNADKNVRARSEPKKKGPRTKDETKMSFLSRRDLDGGERAEQCGRPRERAEETARPGRERDLEVLLVDEEILVLARPRQTDRAGGRHVAPPTPPTQHF